MNFDRQVNHGMFEDSNRLLQTSDFLPYGSYFELNFLKCSQLLIFNSL